jgi:hypothetical protein
MCKTHWSVNLTGTRRLEVTGVNGSIKIDFRVIGLECLDSIHVGQYADCFKYGNEQLGSIKSAKFLYS